MLIKDILHTKGSSVLKISPDASLADVVDQLVAHNCGSLVVCEGERMVGIITERDILRTVSATDEPLNSIRVQARMTNDVVTGTPDDEVDSVMGLLTEKRIRHLPVLADGRLAGMISIGDVVKAKHDKLTMENHYLKNYIQS